MATVFTVDGVTKLIYQVLERDYGVTPTGGTLTTGATGGSGGLTQAQVQTLINTAIAGLPTPTAGVTTQQVDAAIAAAVAALPPAGISQAQAQTAIADALAALPVPLTVGEVEGLVAAAIAAIPPAPEGLTVAQVDEIVQAALAEVPPGGLDEAAVVAVIERKLTEFGPALQEAIASQVGRVTDKMTLNSTKAGDGPVVFETNNLTGAQHKVGVDFVTQRDGEVTVNGKRVLTVDDAIDPSGVDAAAVEAAVAPLAAEIAKKADTAYVQEQFGNFNDLLQADITGVAQEVLKKADKTVVDSLTADLNEGLQLLQSEYTALADQIIQWVVAEYTTKAEFQALLEAIGGSTVEEVAEMFRGLNDGIAAMVDQAFVDKSPGLVAAISDYLSINLGLFFPANAATKADIEAAKTDILKSLSGGKVVTDKPWTECPKSTNGASTSSTGTVEARVLNGIVTFRGSVTLANPLPSTDSWVQIRNLPAGFPKPDATFNVAVNGLVSGTAYAPAGLRVLNGDGSIMALSTSATAVKTFDFNGLMYQAF